MKNALDVFFDLLNFESFRSKRPIELEGLRVIFLGDRISFNWAKRKTTVCVI